ncbi:MAG: molecular chaperone DnaK, partial [Gammaproteobacteria bacterium]|nr:molecular chaperone DnaK [Gammaproteobacteria bacterium]
NIESAKEELKAVQGGEDVEAIKAAVEKLTEASHKLAEVIYNAAQQQNAQGDAGAHQHAEEPSASAKDENVVDADFEEVKDDKKIT